MNELITRHVFADDLSPEQSWTLAAWCVARGADSFSATTMGIQGEPTPACDAFEAALAPAALGVQRRRVIVRPETHERTGEVPAWRLTSDTLAVLRAYSGPSLLRDRIDTARGWLEDPIFWRGGDVMLAVVSHEGEGVVRVTSGEAADLRALGIATRDVGEWVGY